MDDDASSDTRRATDASLFRRIAQAAADVMVLPDAELEDAPTMNGQATVAADVPPPGGISRRATEELQWGQENLGVKWMKVKST